MKFKYQNDLEAGLIQTDFLDIELNPSRKTYFHFQKTSFHRKYAL